MTDKRRLTVFTDADIESFKPVTKVGILATVNEAGLPHLTLLPSLQAASSSVLTFGQFTEGLSKAHVVRHPKVGFLIMTLSRELWRGTAAFTHREGSGLEYEAYNKIPMFRYNSYFGVHTVYYFDLVKHSGKERLPMGRIVGSTLATMAASALARKPGKAVNPLTRELMNTMGNLKFAAYVAHDGFPRIIPVIQAQAAGDRIIFSIGAYGDELGAIPPGVSLAVFALTLKMEDVLVRGTYRGVRRLGGLACGLMDVDWVYNSMPPVPGQIYPPKELAAVEFPK
jgi:hypothetical protein